MKRFWQIGNIVALGFALTANYLVGAQQLGLPAINEISDKYATLLTPAGYAFGIWSLIYILLIAAVIYMARDIFKPSKANTLPQTVGPFLLIANIANGLWTYIFVSEILWLSVIVLLILTISLYIALFRSKAATYQASLATTAFVWWPILIYTGWVTVATVVNIASWLASLSIEINAFGAIATLVTLTAILLALLFTRHVRELVLASAWGIGAIAAQQGNGGDWFVWVGALTVTFILIIAMIGHAFMHRKAFIAIK